MSVWSFYVLKHCLLKLCYIAAFCQLKNPSLYIFEVFVYWSFYNIEEEFSNEAPIYWNICQLKLLYIENSPIEASDYILNIRLLKLLYVEGIYPLKLLYCKAFVYWNFSIMKLFRYLYYKAFVFSKLCIIKHMSSYWSFKLWSICL